jgi:hypothetical protein
LWKNLLTNVKIEQIVKRFAARGSFAFKPEFKQIILSEETMKKLLKHKRNISIFLVMALVLTLVPGSMFIEDADIGYVDLTGNNEINLSDSDISNEDNDETVLSYTEDDVTEDIDSDSYIETNLIDSDVLTEDNIGLTEILSGVDDVAGVDAGGFVGVEQTDLGVMAVNINAEKLTPVSSNLEFTIPPTDLVYNGSTQGIGNVTNNSGESALNTFTIDYRQNGTTLGAGVLPTNAGTYTVYAVFTETEFVNQTDVELGTYTIAPLDITGAYQLGGSFVALTYRGLPQTPSRTVTTTAHGDSAMTVTGTWTSVTDRTDQTTFEASGNFTGSTAAQNTGMAPFSINNYTDFDGDFIPLTYTGLPQTPSGKTVKTRYGSGEYMEVTGAWGTVTDVLHGPTFTASGNFAGTVTLQSSGMQPLDISVGYELGFAFTGLTYTGLAQRPNRSVRHSGLSVTTGDWNNVTNVGEYTTFTARGNFTGSTQAYDPGMAARSLFGAIVTFAPMTFDGTPQTPVAATFTSSATGGIAVTGGSWSPVTNVGEMTTYTPSSNFVLEGFPAQNPGMQPLNISTGYDLDGTAFAAFTYNGSEQTPVRTVTHDALTGNVTGTWSNVTNVGELTTFTPTAGNFIGTITGQNPNMSPLNVGTGSLNLTFNPMTYTGSVQTPATSTFTVNTVPVTGGSWSQVTNVSDTTTYTSGGGNFTGMLADRVTGMSRIPRPSAPYNLSADVRAEYITTGRTITLPELPPGATYPAAGGTLGGTTALISSQSISGNTLTINTTDQAVDTSATITINVTDATNYNPYTVTVTVTAKAAVREDEPNAEIDFFIEELTGLTPNGIYSVNGINITVGSDGHINIAAGWIGTTITIIKPGIVANDTIDSNPQSLIIPARPAAPAGVGKTDTTGGQSNGTITGVNNTMEYKLSTATTWTVITGEAVTGLAAGTYNVRFLATIYDFASAQTANLVIASSTAPEPEPDPDPEPPVSEVVEEPGTITDVSLPATIKFSGSFNDFHSASKDGNTLTLTLSENGTTVYLSGYPGFTGNIGEAVSGSTIITIYEAFLQTLPNGTYTFSVSFRDSEGVIYASPEVTYVINRVNNPNNPPAIVQNNPAGLPRTGVISSITIWVTLLLISIAVTVSILVWHTWFKKKSSMTQDR